jgi:Pyridoxamine 5'-phosphate oxidase
VVYHLESQPQATEPRDAGQELRPGVQHAPRYAQPVPIRLTRPLASSRLERAARSLLEASTLCALSTVSGRGAPQVNTAYFAVTADLSLIWLSDPGSAHSGNVRRSRQAAAAVYDSHQRWGGPDRGIQLFGLAEELVGGAAAGEAATVYAARFPAAGAAALGRYRYYRLRPRRVKLFDEAGFGSGVFVTATVRRGGRLVWQRTERIAG